MKREGRDIAGNLAPTPILSERGQVGLNPAYRWDIDLQRFDALLRHVEKSEALLKETASQMRGEPLTEDRYEEWATPIRERVVRQWREVCLQIGQRAAGLADFEAAIAWFERPLQFDALDEEALQKLLAVLLQAGRRTEALRLYRNFQRQLEKELGVGPSVETQRLVARARKVSHYPPDADVGQESVFPDHVTPAYPLPAATPLVGREEELRRILATLHGEENVGMRCVLIEAEAGVGKTRLLAEVALYCQERGFLVLAGGSYEQEGHLPYAPLHDALLDYIQAQPVPLLVQQFDEILPDLARIVPEIRSQVGHVPEIVDGDVESARLRLYSIVAQTLSRIATHQPLLLILDDLHWADNATLRLLHFLVRQPQPDRVHLLGAYRPEEIESSSPLEGFVSARMQQGAHPIPRIRLAPLTPQSIHSLVEEVLCDRCSDGLIEMLHDRSAGNPFFAQEILLLLREQGQLARGPHGWESVSPAPPDLPPLVRETIRRRLRHLGQKPRELVMIGAVLGREFPFPLLEAMWQGDEESLFNALDAAVDTQVMAETEDGYAFRHPLLREVVYAYIPRARRPRLHARAGLTLETFYAQAPSEHSAELAYHFEIAGHSHGGQAARYLTLAGEVSARALAWSEAADYYRRAETYVENGEERALLDEKRGTALLHLSRYDDALECLERAASAYQHTGSLESEGRAVALIGRAHVDRGTAREGLERVHPVMERLEISRHTPGVLTTLVRLHGILFYLHAMSDQPNQSVVATAREVELARRLGEDRARVSVVLRHAMALLIADRLSEAVPLVDEVELLAEELENVDILSQLSLFRSQSYLVMGDLRRSVLYTERNLQFVRQRGAAPDVVAFYLSNVAEVRFLLGEWNEAHSLLSEALQAVQPLADSWYTGYPRLTFGVLLLARGEWESAAQHLEAGLAVAERNCDIQAMRLARGALAEYDVLRGNPAAALRHIEPLLDRLGSDGPSVDEVLPVAARAYFSVGNRLQAEQIISTCHALIERRRHYRLLPELLCVQGEVLSKVEEWEGTEAAFERAIESAQTMHCPYAEARARYAYGLTLARQERGTGAILQLRSALALFRHLGAAPFVRWTEEALRRVSGADIKGGSVPSGEELSPDGTSRAGSPPDAYPGKGTATL